mmetsp:Transcript_15765/g.32584  ORF Transcript_15765/g.32584 Transcript_15765/m.32584 type:complete len:118 (-) Transcript_15765:86-439(-)
MILKRKRFRLIIIVTSTTLAILKRGDLALAKCAQTVLNGIPFCKSVAVFLLGKESNIPAFEGVTDWHIPGHTNKIKPDFWVSISSEAPRSRYIIIFALTIIWILKQTDSAIKIRLPL